MIKRTTIYFDQVHESEAHLAEAGWTIPDNCYVLMENGWLHVYEQSMFRDRIAASYPAHKIASVDYSYESEVKDK